MDRALRNERNRLPTKTEQVLVWTGLLALAAMSYISCNLAVSLMIAACAIAVIRWPDWSLAIAAFILGFRQIFVLNASQSIIVMAAVLGMVALQTALDRRTLPVLTTFQHRPLLLLLALSLGLDVAHLPWDWSDESKHRFAWHALAMFAAIRAAALASDARAMRALRNSVVAAAAIGALISAIYLYLPWPALIGDRFVHTEIMRLDGVRDGANATALSLLPVVIAALLAQPDLNRPWSLLLIAASAIALYATASKSALVAFAVALLFGFLAGRPKQTAIYLLAATAAGLVWYGAIEAPLKRHAAMGWTVAHLSNDSALVDAYAFYVEGKPSTKGINEADTRRPIGRALSSLRIETRSDPLIRQERKAPIPLFDTGSRYLLWNAGLQVVSAHPWWGIGAAGWPQQMRARLGRPYLSPHNGLLQATGSYGFMGGLIYLAILARVFWLIFRREGESWPLWVIGSIFCFELFDVSSILTPTVFTPMIWMLFGWIDEGSFSPNCWWRPRRGTSADELVLPA